MLLGAQGGMGSGPGILGIGVNIYANDMYTPVVRGIMMTNQQFSAQVNNLNSMARNFYTAAALVGAGVLNMASSWYEYAARFDHIMTWVGATAQGTAQQYKDLRIEASRIAAETQYNPQQIAGSMQIMALAGRTKLEIAQMADQAASLAAATMAPLEGIGGATDILNYTMSSFKLAASQAKDVSNILTAGVTRSPLMLSQLGEGIKYVGDTVSSLNISLEDTTAMLMVLATAGIRGSMAGTSLANAFRYMSVAIGKPRPQQLKALAALGLSPNDFRDAQGNMIGLSKMFAMIRQGAKGMNNIDVQNIFKDIFNIRGKRGIWPLISNVGMFEEKQRDIELAKATNASLNLRNIMMESMEGQIWIMKSSWDNFRVQFGTGLKELGGVITYTVKTIFNALSIIVNWPGMKYVLQFTVAMIGLRTVVFGFRAVMLGYIYLQNQMNFAMGRYGVTATGATTATNAATAATNANTAANARNAASMGFMATMRQRFSNSAYAASIIAQHTTPMVGPFKPPQITRNKHGQYYYAGSNMRFDSREAAQRHALANPAQAGINTTHINQASNRVTTAMNRFRVQQATNMGTQTGVLRLMSTRIMIMGAGVIGKAATFMNGMWMMLGGWYGVAITALVIGISNLVTGLSNNEDAMNVNSSAINENTGVLKKVRKDMMFENIVGPAYQRELILQTRALERNLAYQAELIKINKEIRDKPTQGAPPRPNPKLNLAGTIN